MYDYPGIIHEILRKNLGIWFYKRLFFWYSYKDKTKVRLLVEERGIWYVQSVAPACRSQISFVQSVVPER